MKFRILCLCMAVTLGAWAHADIPLRHITLFNSGVGYFERQGVVSGDEQAELSFRREQISDVIKSLVLIDQGGGTVSAVTYDAPDPLERTLRSFAIDLTDNPSLPDLLDRLRGASVRVKVSAQDHAGQVVGVERKTRRVEDAVFTEYILNLYTAQGVRPVRLDEVQELEVLDESLAKDFSAALAVLAGQMDQTRKGVRLQFRGEGERRVRVGYMLETPIWKTSYRVVIGDDALLLQGWAHLENMTDDDWEDVAVSLVSGRPISFMMNLYDPIYVKRPEVKHRLHEEVKPPEYAREMPMMAMAAPARRAAKFDEPQESFGFSDFGAQKAVAVGEEAGELFQYVIAEPVSIPRQSSAMLPIVQTSIKGEALSIFNESVHGRHPLNGVELENTSDVFLMQGPVTVFEGGIYAGDARLPDTQMGETRFLGYAMDLATEMSVDRENFPHEIVSMKIVRGVLHAQREFRESVKYRIRSLRDRARLLLIEHPIKAGWELQAPEGEPERTADHYRFRIPLQPGESRSVEVRQRQIQEQTIALTTLKQDRIDIYLRQRVISPKMKAALETLIAHQAALAELERERRDVEQVVAEITKEQERIRQNMTVVQRPSDSFSMWERKLIEQEEELGRLNAALTALREDEAGKVRAMNEWLAQLTVE